MDSPQPIIVKRVSRKADGHHGGSWKIAFADFAIAMMAFFLVMWLVTVATPEQLKMVSAYFKDPINFDGGSPHPIDLGGSPTPAPQRTLNELDSGRDQLPEPLEQLEPMVPARPEVDELPDKMELRELDLLLQELQNKIDTEPVLQRFRDQILMEFTLEGLRIQIVDAENRPMFASGSPELRPYFEEILLTLADTIAKVPKRISISGHTDAMPYTGRRDYGNWELSTQRANAARRTLLAAGYPEQQVARVVGYADSALFDADDPLNPINRRIDIVVMNKRAEFDMRRQAGAERPQGGSAQADPAFAPEGASPDSQSAGDSAPAADELPATPPSERPRNLFDDDSQSLELRL
ncbi:flagellar motor protein MotB [Halopseudomonas sp. SMJS2]|uniref:flagellar motor protein MotB n=1 Tax=Halopseudomonas sp. SMJS2 TaxID=3041098 RepID=UPI002452FD16|nr:flagellar motor protein MotB [Halopseudomonas sp. SMJS2]WGK62590.1 flagellar motor protein MotB [Halopseudomonas sp. SMJS2]